MSKPTLQLHDTVQYRYHRPDAAYFGYIVEITNNQCVVKFTSGETLKRHPHSFFIPELSRDSIEPHDRAKKGG